MKVKANLLKYFHLDRTSSLMSARGAMVALEMFKLLDIHQSMAINDLQFVCLMSYMTDLNEQQIYLVFDMLDIDGSGEIEFGEFYLLICILTAIKDKDEKQFIYRHSRNVFDLLDEDGSNSISAEEFQKSGFLFNFEGLAVKRIFHEYDVSGDAELDYKEFRMFAMACIDKQNELTEQHRLKMEKKREKMIAKEQKKNLSKSCVLL